MAIGWDEGNPTDNSIVSQFPSNERDQRAVQASAWALEHDDNEGRHSFGVGNTAARDAITSWTTGAIWINTSAGLGGVIMQGVVSVTASPSWQETSRFTSADDVKLDAVISASSATSAEAAAGSETGIRAWSPIIIKAAVSSNIPIASQADMETATNNTNVVTPLRANDHPGACKAWVNFQATGAPSINDDFNVSSIGDDATGEFTINMGNDMSSTNYAVFTDCQRNLADGNAIVTALKDSTSDDVLLVGSFSMKCFASNSLTKEDPFKVVAGAFGDQ